MPRPIRPAAAALLLALATSLGAQDAERDTTALASLVVTATRLPTPGAALTATVTVLDGDALRAEGLTHLGDALRRVPGLAIARTSSFGSQQALFLRGGQSNYVRLLIDGVPMNEPGGVLDLGRITLDDVERIEVVRGPASVLYGSEAVTGVIQVFTRGGRGALRTRSELGGSSYGGRRASLGVSAGGAFGRWSLQGDHHGSDGILPYNNAYRNQGAVATWAAGDGTRGDLRITARYNTSIYRYPTGSDGSVEDRNAERTEHRFVIGLDGGHRWTDRVESRLQLSAMDLLPRTNDGADDVGDTLGFYGFFARATVARRVADARTTVRIGEAQFVTAGAEFSRDTERSRSNSQSEFGDFPSTFSAARETRAVYLQGQGARGALDYTLGARLDDNSEFGTFRTVRAGFGWRLSRALRLRTSAGTAFKAPTFFENFAEGFTLGNPGLRPEMARSADAGIEWTLPGGASVRATAFAQRFRDLIQYNGSAAPGEPNYYNVAAANAGGLEFEATLPRIGASQITLGHTWTDTRVVDAGFDVGAEANFVNGGRLLRRPAHVSTAQLVRTLRAAGTLTVGVHHIGNREDRDFATFPATVVVLPAYLTIDAGLELRLPAPLVRGARLQLRVENLADVRTEQIAGFASPGRVLSAGLKLER
jgi:outer membrane cobalamin receptor